MRFILHEQDYYWRIPFPGTDWTVYEGMVDPVMAKLLIALTVWAVCFLGMLAWHRMENWIKSDRSKSCED